ncbi:MAG TPA: PAS domain S-box protein [Burkholderiaceae bacterium]|nr:PAS domain S-box protein [Burkholderiaceae bacterium]
MSQHPAEFAPPGRGSLFEQIPTGFIKAVRGCVLLLLDDSGQLIVSNRGTRELTGYDEDELTGKLYTDVFIEAGQEPRALQACLELAERQGTYEAQGWLRRKDGTQLWGALALSPVVNHEGVLQGYAALIRDIGEARVQSTELSHAERQFRMLVQGVRDYAIYMLDPDGYITNWNAGAELIKGYTADEIIGRHFSTFYTEEDQLQGAPQRSLETAVRENTFQSEAWRVRKDGSLFWASVVIDPIYDEHGTLLGFAKITRDITDKRRNQEKVDRQRETVHQAQKLEALGRLTGSVAHDFNNMLSVIRTAAEMLGSGMTLQHDTEHYVKMITDASERAARLTDQLLTFARQRPFRLEVFSPATRIDTMLQVMQTSLGSRNELVVDVASDLGMIESDTSQFDTALLNLVINARDAMSESGSVTITARNVRAALEDGEAFRDWVTVQVRDTGSGIDPDVLPKIFDPFFTTKEDGRGTGLGLSQVYGFVRQSGGDIKVESTRNKGTAFTLYLPRATKKAGDSWGDLLTPTAESELAEALQSAAKSSGD